jgi:hypothetical protein
MTRVGVLSTHSPNSDSRRLGSGASAISLGSASRCSMSWQKIERLRERLKDLKT